MILLLSLLIFVPKIFCGFALVHWFWEDLDLSGIVIKVGLGFALGMAISSSLFFLAVRIGITPKTYSLVEFWAFLVVAILIFPRFIYRLKANLKFSRLSWQDHFSLAILLTGAALLVYAFLLYSRMHPYGFEDAWSIWNYTARFIYRTNVPSLLFDDQVYDRFHPDYPLGLGLNVAWGWFVLNKENTNLPIAIAFYVIVSPALLLWGALKKWRGTLPAMSGALLYLMNPSLKWSVGQMADILLALYMLSAVIMLYGYLRSYDPGLFFMAGLLAGFSAWIKNEGILFVCVFLLVSSIMVFKQLIKRDALKQLGLGMLLPMLVVVTYKLSIQASSDLFESNNPLSMQIFYFQRWWTTGREFLTNALHYGDWPVSIVVLLLLYALLLGFDNSEYQRHIWLLFIILGQFAGYYCIYLLTPHDLDWHLSTSVDRVISHLFPMVFFWIFTALEPPILVFQNHHE